MNDICTVTVSQYRNLQYLVDDAKRYGLEFCINDNKFTLKLNSSVIYANSDLGCIGLFLQGYKYGHQAGVYKGVSELKKDIG